MFRDLKALEIAEGALLADIAVLFQVLAIYFPVGGEIFRMLIFIVFAVLVLRRGLYVGIMGFCVALFVVTVTVGSHSFLLMILQCLGGLFLGVTMKRRMRLLPLLLVGVTGGSLAFYGVLFLTSLVFGIPLSSLADLVHSAYTTAIALINGVTAHIGLALWWKQTLYPPVSSFADIAFRYWALSLYIGIWLVLIPVVFSIYMMTNTFVRLLGYDVRPFPGGQSGQSINRRGIRRALKLGLIKGRRKVNA